MSRQIIFSEDARTRLLAGAEVLHDAVACTLGPKGRNVLMKTHDHPAAPLVLTRDGVTVAKEVRDLAGTFENMGCTMLRDAAMRTGDLAGDGTTTSTVLAWAMLSEGVKHIDNGANPMAMVRGMEKAVKIIVERLKEMAIPVTTDEQIVQIGMISSRDRAIGELVLQAMRKVGRDGVITLGESPAETRLHFTEGMQIDRGLIAQPLVTDEQRQECVLDNPYILLTERKLLTMTQPIVDLMLQINTQSRPVLFIGGDYDQPFVVWLIANRQLIRTGAVKAPGFGEERTSLLEDMAVVTGGYAFTENCGRKLESVEMEDLGQATRVVITRDSTTISGGYGTPDRIASRTEHLRSMVELSRDDLERERYRRRLARLASGIAEIQVGGVTDVERRELRDRVEDAVMATKAAVEEGILPGGGKALMECCWTLAPELNKSTDPDEKIGMGIVYKSLSAPLSQICQNAGKRAEEISLIAARVVTEKDLGYNAANDQFEDLIAAGVIDPCKVSRVALQNAAAVAAAMLTCQALIASVPAT